MKKNPLVTVIIPYKNKLDYLFLAIESVFKQTYKSFKIIIIYDNKNLEDLQKIKKFIKLKKKIFSNSIEIINNKKNLGAGYSRNKGIKKSNTKYIAFLDADDIWNKNKLKIQISYMEKNNKVFTHTSYYVINSCNQIISKRNARLVITFEELLKSCDIGLSTVMINSSFLKKKKFFFSKIETKEDYILWLRIVKKIKNLSGIRKLLTYYRKTENSLSSNKFTSIINGYKVYRDYLNYNRIYSLYRLIILSLNYIKKNLNK